MKKRITALIVGIIALITSARAQAPTVTFTASSSSICAGSSVNFSNSYTGTPTSWTWYFPGGVPSDTVVTSAPGNPGSITYPNAGTYYVTCVVRDSAGADSVTIQNCIKVLPSPQANITPPSGGICGAGDTIYFTVTGTNGNTYAWSPPGSLSCSSCTNANAYPTTNTVYTITATGTNGCTSTYYDSVTVGSITVTISGKDSICQGMTDSLIASGGASNAQAATAYEWSTGQTTSSITVSPGSTTVYSCLITSGGCTSTGYFQVVVGSKPLFVLSGADSLCYPNSTTITASGAGNYQYWWYGPFGIVDTNVFTTSPPVTTTYTLVVKNFGCHLDSLVTVKVDEAPHVTFSGATNLCMGSSTIITAAGGNGYHWSNGATTSSINVEPYNSITYTLQVTKGACFKDTTFTIVVDTMPEVKFKGDTSICTGDSTTIYVSGGYTYLWNTGSTADSVSGVYTTTETYYVTVTKGACSKDSEQIAVKVYPRPKPVLYPIDSTNCEFDSVPLTVTGGNYYVWSPKHSGLNHYIFYGDTDVNKAAPPITTAYKVNVCTWGCCKDTGLVLNILPGPSGDVCCNTTVSSGTPVPLSVTFPPGSTFLVEQWSPSSGLSCSNCQDPTATVSTTTTYTVILENTYNGCTAEDSVTIDILNCTVFVPNVFSPGESVNNRLYVRSLCLTNMDFAVFDRYGNKVFETHDQNTPWDGTYNGRDMELGTYIWYLNGQLDDGTHVEKSGNVTLLR